MKKRNKNIFDKLFLLSWKRSTILLFIFLIVFFFRNKTIRILFEPLGLYNFVYYVFSIGILLYLLISLVYTFVNKERMMKHKKTKKKNNFDKFFLFSWKKLSIGLIVWIAAVFFHNMVYAFFKGIFGLEVEEPFFFIIAVIVIPVYFVVITLYTLIKKLMKIKR